jgi:formyltetrahydrofolate-dependent phosphoribosylglycinamide formyltransferase
MVKKKACVFISGTGSNLKHLIINSFSYNFPVKISLIISSKKEAKGLLYAKKYAIPFLIFKKDKLSESKIINELRKRKIELICLAGFMKILSKNFLRSFKKNIINIHPSLLPKFKGLNTYQKILKNKEKKTGCTVHYVNEKLDDGEIIAKKMFFVDNKDNIISLKKKTQKLEYQLFSEAIIKIFRN